MLESNFIGAPLRGAEIGPNRSVSRPFFHDFWRVFLTQSSIWGKIGVLEIATRFRTYRSQVVSDLATVGSKSRSDFRVFCHSDKKARKSHLKKCDFLEITLFSAKNRAIFLHVKRIRALREKV